MIEKLELFFLFYKYNLCNVAKGSFNMTFYYIIITAAFNIRFRWIFSYSNDVVGKFSWIFTFTATTVSQLKLN